MLPSRNRIRRKYFKEIFSKGSFYHTKNISLVVLKTKEIPSQFAFSVSKKVSSKAVARNKLRRRGYAVLTKLLPFLKPSFQAVFILKPQVLQLSFEEMEKEILKLLNQAGILKARQN